MTDQLKKIYQHLSQKWLQLAERDKRILKIGSVITTILIAYAGVWSPLTVHVALLRERVKAQDHLLAFMRAADAALKQGNQQSAAGFSSMVAELAALKKQIGLAQLQSQVRLLKQNADDEIALNMQQVPFDQFINLLLQEKHLQISQLTVVALKQIGMVNAQVIFKLKA